MEQREPETILVVDDDAQNLELLDRAFRGQYDVVTARGGEQALKLARTDPPPDLILLDILMPRTDGYQVCRRLKDDERTRDIPVIFITALSEVMDEAKSFDLGAVDFVSKPIFLPAVKARVELHLALRRKQEMLEKYAYMDGLTEIPNRRNFDVAVRKEWRRAMRSEKPLSLIFMDVDDFNAYKDNLGHGKGDECLRRLAQAVQGSLKRAGDFVARYGGEEFAAVLPYTGRDKALDTARLIASEVEQLSVPHPSGGLVSLSMGVVTALPRESITIVRLLEEADRALYSAKAQGRNRIEQVVLGESA